MERKYIYEVEVERVIDGDTFASKSVDLGMGVALTGSIHFRLLGVNTPERKMPGYIEATAFTKTMIEGKKILVETHAHDAFGRWLCTIYLPEEEKSINQQLLEKRLAVIFK
jgi:endonuclease YncB( thermonuclease family)